MAGDERTLATWLASLDDNALADLFTRRGVSPAASWRDFFDAAEALLDPASIDRALARLDRRVPRARRADPLADGAREGVLHHLALELDRVVDAAPASVGRPRAGRPRARHRDEGKVS